ncbi:MAG: L-threonylcarbamoyladenylate synthase [Patescibacteria group bacterium]|nr:L-threonylcarbamoyladenylate synthase [Patescibacteria group bacterium]
MKIIKVNDPKVVEKSVAVLKNGGMLVYPCETCYGIGVDATNPKAVNKLLNYKSFREDKPISVAVSSKNMACKYADINEIANNLYDNFLPGPITVVSKGLGNVAEHIESKSGTIGIRIPDYPVLLNIISQFRKPITATSANPSYKPQPYSITQLIKNLSKKQVDQIDLIIDAGKLPRNEVSTVVDTTMNTMNVLRQGSIVFDRTGKSILSANTKSSQDTIDFGATIILKFIDELHDKALVLALGGELGTGKTQLAKGIAKQLGIEHNIKSPTFNIINEFSYRLDGLSGKLIHIDTWRIADKKELERLDLHKYLIPGNVVVVEWADKYFDLLEKLFSDTQIALIKVKFEFVTESEREIKAYEAI